MVVDQLNSRGVEIAGCSQISRDFFDDQNIAVGSGKLVDVTLAGTKYETVKTVVSQLMNDPETGVLVVVIGSSSQFYPDLAVQPVLDAVKEANASCAPVFAFPVPHAPDAITLLEQNDVPAFRSIESCGEVIAHAMAVRPLSPIEQVDLCERLHEVIAKAPNGALQRSRFQFHFQSAGY